MNRTTIAALAGIVSILTPVTSAFAATNGGSFQLGSKGKGVALTATTVNAVTGSNNGGDITTGAAVSNGGTRTNVNGSAIVVSGSNTGSTRTR